MTQENTTFLGFDRKQIPLLSLILAGFIMLAGMFYQLNANVNALSAKMDALSARMDANDNALRAEMNANDRALRTEIIAMRAEIVANDNAFRAEIRALDVRVNDVAVEMVKTNARMTETNARLENIERLLPEYDSLDTRLNAVERDQTLTTDRIDALVSAE